MRLVLFAAFASLTLAAPAGAADLFGSAPPLSFSGRAGRRPRSRSARTGMSAATSGSASIRRPRSSAGAVCAAARYLGFRRHRPAAGSSAGFAGDLGFRLSLQRLPADGRDLGLLDQPEPHALFRRHLPLWPQRRRESGRPARRPDTFTIRPTPAPARRVSASTTTPSWRTAMSISEPTAGSRPMSAAASASMSAACRGAPVSSRPRTASAYAANLTSTGAFPLRVGQFGRTADQLRNPASCSRRRTGTERSARTTYRFAWALAAGFGFQLTPSATLDIGYRYLNGGQANLLVNPQTGLTVKQNNISQQVLVGVRYLLQ